MAALNVSLGCGSSQGLIRSSVSPPESPPLPSVSAEGKAKVDMLVVQVEALVLSEDHNTVQKLLKSLRDAFTIACSDSETLEYAVQRLHNCCLKDRSMCSKVAAACNTVSGLEVDSVKLRAVLLNCVQKDYENRQEMQAKYPARFLNAVALLGELYTRFRISDRPIAVLLIPLLEYLDVLLTGDEAEFELFGNMVAVHGRALQESGSGLEKVLVKVRSTLVSRNLSSQCRLWLLYVIDIANNSFSALSNTLLSFYQEHLGEKVQNISSLQITLNGDFQLSQTNESAKSPSVPSSGDSSLPQQISNIAISRKTNTPAKSTSGHRSGRGVSGAVVDKRDNFRSAVQGSSDKGKGKSYWLHDDRFEKEEESYVRPSGKDMGKPKASDSDWRQTPNKTNKVEKEGVRAAPSSSKPTHVSNQHQEEENWDD